ncbi:hypothetical protein LPJ61_003016 [Coemansia biformis]|uniref:CYRIA/CYRIB Rac1 binding domain-containing protein n=1 Tax=Coemansia biformis TaxID=1286918 RepID=A0A9W7YBC3_9FUNG|nr:hypothetical protein LPJ61_003016 [Coemansia biformis]
MGALLSMLRGGGSGSSSGGGQSGGLTRLSRDTYPPARFSKQFNEFICNLGDARNAEYVEANFPEGSMVVRAGSELLERVGGYQDGTSEVRAAITQRTPESEEAAWRKIGPSVSLLRECFELAQGVERIVPGILDELCSHGGDEGPGRTDRNRGLARLLADLMQNAFEFDALKASIPAIQNDFSYYRRTLARIANCQEAEIAQYSMPQDVSNQMSLFYAHHNPMVRTVVDSATRFARDSSNGPAVLDCLAALAAGSLSTIKRKRAGGAASEQTCVLVLVTCCVLYDWIAPQGICGAQSGIDAKAVLAVVGGRPVVGTTAADKVLRANCLTLR